MRISFKAALLLGGSAALAGCGQDYDPLTREGLWHPNHANHSNLALMAANPADLVRGTGVTTGDGQLAAAAVDRLRTDKVKKLPASDIATFGAGNTGDNSGGGSGSP